MSTNTPRTDAFYFPAGAQGSTIYSHSPEKSVEFARKLESDLDTANEQLLEWVKDHKPLKERLARLRELAELFLPSDSRDDMVKHRALRAELEKKP